MRPHVAAQRPCLTFSSDGRILAYVARDGSVGQLDLTTAAEPTEQVSLESPGAMPTGLAAIPGGSWAGAVEGRLVVWDLPAGRTPRVSTSPAEGGIASLAISSDGTLCATGGDRSLTIWELTGLRVRAVLRDRNNLPPPVRAVAFSHDGRTLITALGLGGVQLWNLATGRPIVIVGRNELVPDTGRIAIAPDDSSLAAVLAEDSEAGMPGFLWRTDRAPESRPDAIAP